MRLGRRSKPAGRQRLRPQLPVSISKNFGASARRFEAEPNTGRNLPREVARPLSNRAQFWLQRFGLIVLSIAVLASVVKILTLSSHAKVLPLSSAENSYFLRDMAVYEAAASDLLADSIWNRNKITANTGYVSQQLLKQFPELTAVSITVPLLAHRPLVYVQPSQPALILVASNGSFVVANNGKALLKGDSPEALNQSKLPLVNDQSGLKLELNKPALPSTTINFIQEIMAQLATKQFSVTVMTLPAASRQLDVQLANQPYIVKFNLQADTAREQAGTFLATLVELQKQGVAPTKYVDVRVPGRAYYQ